MAFYCGYSFWIWIVAALYAVPSALSKFLCEELENLEHIIYHQFVLIFELSVSCELLLCPLAFTFIMTARRLVESSCSVSEGKEIPQLKTRRNTAKIVVGLNCCFYNQLCALTRILNFTAKP